MRTKFHRLVLTMFAWLAVALGANAASESTTLQLEFALYFAPQPKADPDAQLDAWLKQHPEVAKNENATKAISVSAEWRPLIAYAPPDEQAFRFFSCGLTEEQGRAMREADRVWVLQFTAPAADPITANQLAGKLIAELADQTGGNPWDEECRLVYSAAEWRKARVDSWQGNVPFGKEHVTMHSYRENDKLLRVVSLGMKKFGQPDLAIRGIPSDAGNDVARLLAVCIQTMLEGQRPKNRKLTLDLDALRHDGARKVALERLFAKAEKRTEIEFRVAKPEKGDPENRIWTPDFPSSKAPSPTERIHEAVRQLFGDWEDTRYIKSGDAEMQAASERARKRFLELEPSLRKGLQFKERLLVKAPFKAKDQTEYMWVEVVEWKPDAVEGILVNDSNLDPELRHGRRMTIRLADVYDFILYKGDGSEEGNETGKVLDAQRK